MAFCVLEHEDLSIELKLLLLVPCQLTAYEAGTKEPVPRHLERLRPDLFLSSFLLLFTKYVTSQLLSREAGLCEGKGPESGSLDALIQRHQYGNQFKSS
jgi:hypothetical protein